MKKRNVILTSLILGLAGSTLIGVNTINFDNSLTAVWADSNFKTAYKVGQKIYIPDQKATIEGHEIAVTPKVVFPSKKVINKCSITADEIGQYSVVYETIYNDKAYSKTETFAVESNFFDLGINSSSYYGRPENAASQNGLVFNLAQGDEILFNQPIDVHDFTSDDYIICGYIAPENIGTYDFEKLLITFYDSEDPNIWYRQHIRRRDMVTDGVNDVGCAYYYGGGNGQGTAGSTVKTGDPDAVNKNNEWGPMSRLPFDGKFNITYDWPNTKEATFPDDFFHVDDYSFRISIDMESLQVYTTERQRDRTGAFVQGSAEYVKHFITDLDDPVYYAKLFEGFPSGKIKVGITADMYNREFAKFVITDIASLDLEETVLNDTEGPQLKIEVDRSSLPYAQVGKNILNENYSYLIPKATATDNICAETNIKVGVYFNYGTDKQQEIPIKNNRFETKKVGWYTIEYIAYDSFNNATVETLSVFCGKQIPELKIQPINKVDNILVGKYLKAADYTVENSSGDYEAKVTLQDPDGNDVVLTDNFIVEASGTWKVKYEVRDMIGRIATNSYDINASISPKPILRDDSGVTLPKAIISGGTYELPTLTAVKYVDDYDYDEYECDLTISCNGQDVEFNGEYVAENDLTNNIPVKCTYKCGEDVMYEEEVPYVAATRVGYDVEDDFDYLMFNFKNYFIGENFEIIEDHAGDKLGMTAKVESEQEKSSFYFANPILFDKFVLELKTLKNAANYSGVNVKLIDFDNKENTITSKIRFENNKTTLTIDGVTKEINIQGNKDNKFSLSYSDGQILFEDNDSIVTKFDVAKNDLGKVLEGFESHKAYFEVTLLDAKANDSIIVSKINNHPITKNENDNDGVQPDYYFLGNLGGTYSQNKVYKSPILIVQDVFAPNIESTITITSPKGISKPKNVSTLKSYNVPLTELGDYKLTYIFSALLVNELYEKRTTKITVTVKSVDDIAPTITLNEEMASIASINSVMKISTVTVSDNVDAANAIKVTRLVVAPNGLITTLDSSIKSIKFTMRGKYIIRYMAQDSTGNLSMLDHEVNVK